MNVTANQPSFSSESTSPTSVRQPRFDLYGPVHKLIRAQLSGLLTRMGSTTFADEGAATRITKELEETLRFCEKHIEHEIHSIHPHLAARLPNALAKIDDGHDDHARFVTELRALTKSVTSAGTPDLRALAGHTLYLHYSAFVSDTLAHMVEEERVLQPLMHRHFSDAELIEINDTIVGSMPPEEAFQTLLDMIPAVNGPERAAMLGGMRAGAPPEVFQAFVTALRPRLDTDAWTELSALCPFLG